MNSKFCLIPLTVALLFTSLPAFAQVDPRTWETGALQRIYADVQTGRTSPTKGQIRINEINQIQQEHQNWLNQNGAPTGNVLTPGEINTISSQINVVMANEALDVRGATGGVYNNNYGHGDPHHHQWADQHHPYQAYQAQQVIAQPQQDYHGSWGYKHHWGE